MATRRSSATPTQETAGNSVITVYTEHVREPTQGLYSGTPDDGATAMRRYLPAIDRRSPSPTDARDDHDD
ncbi:hypothetical protein [Halopiger aswanensis]|uniref:hypothetical protein n=1 Tax=Halopiger aswanensis TaxID=148449 RepID=UPI000E715B67|nr:hypothetical protein [Halopiger aswanensis]